MLQAYTIEGDQVLAGGRYYSNKMRPQGILRASVQESIDVEQRRKYSVQQRLRKVEEEEGDLRRQLEERKVEFMCVCVCGCIGMMS